MSTTWRVATIQAADFWFWHETDLSVWPTDVCFRGAFRKSRVRAAMTVINPLRNSPCGERLGFTKHRGLPHKTTLLSQPNLDSLKNFSGMFEANRGKQFWLDRGAPPRRNAGGLHG